MNMKVISICFVVMSLGIMAMAFAILGFSRKDPPIHIIHNMDVMPRDNSQSASAYHVDGRTMRHPPAHTVATGLLKDDDAYFRGMGEDGKPVSKIPARVDEVMIARGRDRYEITCSPCHDKTGSGKGVVVRRGLVPPPSFRDARLMKAPDGELFQVISQGVRTMPAYATHLDEADRWAVVAYIRALQKLDGEVRGPDVIKVSVSDPTAEPFVRKTVAQCQVCHSSDGTRLVGPSFKGLWGKTEELEGGTTAVVDEAYLRESLVDPNAKVVKGYPAAMVNYKDILSEDEIKAVIHFIKGLQ